MEHRRMNEKGNEKRRPRSVDAASQAMLAKAERDSVRTIWDRWGSMQPGCKFGRDGICCRICNMGPCRIIESNPGKRCGACGARADTIVARNLARMIAAGAAAHSDHGRDVARALLLAARGEAGDYQIRNEAKLRALAAEFGIDNKGKTTATLAEEMALAALAEFGQQEGRLRNLSRAPEARQEVWQREGVEPRGIDREVVQLMHVTNMGVDNDYRSILRHGVRTALADGWGGSMIATDLQDVMFGAPVPVRARMNLGVLDADRVNIVVHGHEPVLSEMIVAAARDPELLRLAAEKGASGINLAGICCSANEILMRHGIPVAGNFLQQELAIVTGAVEVMVVDVQCIMPALAEVAKCYHTKLVTTSAKGQFPSEVTHVEFHEDSALDVARKIVRIAIENFSNRDAAKVDIPKVSEDLIAGFTSENTFHFLGGRYRSTYRPLNNGIIEGRIRGLAGVVGCCNPNITHDYGHLEMVKELIRHDVLVVQTGCAALSCAKAGLLRPEGAAMAGRGLRQICEAVGIPPVLHVGSCVDNSRILTALCNVIAEGGLGTDLSDIPAAGAAPEWMSEKAIAIGFYVAASGVFTVFGTPHPIAGSKAVTDYVCGGMAEDYGACFAFEADPVKAAHLMIEHMNRKRAALKLRPMMFAEEHAAAG